MKYQVDDAKTDKAFDVESFTIVGNSKFCFKSNPYVLSLSLVLTASLYTYFVVKGVTLESTYILEEVIPKLELVAGFLIATSNGVKLK